MNEEQLNTDQKALRIILDKMKYGTCAEIGAGHSARVSLYASVGDYPELPTSEWFWEVNNKTGIFLTH